MLTALEILKNAEGTVFVDKQGKRQPIKFLPPITSAELESLEAKAGFTYPSQLRDLLLYARGFEGPLGSADLASPVMFNDEPSFGLDEVFPHGLSLATDGSGNQWVVDLIGGSSQDTAVFYACHDPPVLVYQAESIGKFISEILCLGNDPWSSDVSEVHDDHAMRVWRDNPGVISRTDCLNADPDLKAFAELLDETYQLIDLRQCVIGDGFSWGRYGAETVCKRYNTHRIFAYQTRKPNWFQRIFGF